MKKDITGRSMEYGLQADHFDESLKKSFDRIQDVNFIRDPLKTRANGYEDEKCCPRLPGSSGGDDPYSSIIKPRNVKFWNKVPSSEEEKAIYYGLHIHSEDNPFGLHSHMIGGNLGGAHSHGPQNPFGVHHHKEINPEMETNTTSYQLDGKHIHEYGTNMPCGKHTHSPENFG